MKLNAELNGEHYEIELRSIEGKLFAKVDDREYELESSQPEPNVYLFKNKGEITQIFVSPQLKSGDPFVVNAVNEQFTITITDPKKLRSSSAAGANADGIAEIKTAMPGKLVRVLVDEGAEVSAGDGILVVEAMKMQNEMKSPKDGVVKEIRFTEGATVNAGDVLAIIE
ncbi:MAG: biotin/lipoyl-binding protein [Pyrinomonadaceae bacterium]|nr:biotin/lipoyl-binding protein [Pyrinomonadaceae bacterium]